jgi:hypothetical protein
VPQFDDIDILESRGDSNYHSLQARLQQSFHRGLTALASYTWSKSIDDASSFFSSAGDANYPQNSLNTRAERGLSNFDLRHRFSLSYSYDLPFGKGRLRSGWQTFGIWTFQTGRPFTVALLPDLDNSNTGRSILGFSQRPAHVLRDPELSSRTAQRWFDTTAFDSAIQQLRIAGTSLTGRISEHQRVADQKCRRVRAPTCSFVGAFNLVNHTNLICRYFCGLDLGAIQSAGSPRRVQLGQRFCFEGLFH